MGKYSRELDENLEKKVKQMASQYSGLQGITIEPIKLNSKKAYGEVIKSTELVSLFTGDSDMVCVALNERLFDVLDEQTQDVLIDSLLAMIYYDDEKGKVVINKPEIHVSLGMLDKYKQVAVQKAEVAYRTLESLNDKEKQEKEAKKAEKANAKKKRNYGV